MAFKDRFDKLISYFDTDEVSDVEEEVAGIPAHSKQPQRQTAPQQVRAVPTNQGPARSERTRPNRAQAQVSEHSHLQSQQAPRRTSEEARNIQHLDQHREARTQAARSEQVTTIALKYPRKYEDAQEIVDLLIINECVLIDFQYMLDAQARRCIDFIDGASKVLYGTLQKVGGSMYLLAPSNVVVDIEEISTHNASQEHSFDFDMKRR